jgi:hypothetical protein
VVMTNCRPLPLSSARCRNPATTVVSLPPSRCATHPACLPATTLNPSRTPTHPERRCESSTSTPSKCASRVLPTMAVWGAGTSNVGRTSSPSVCVAPPTRPGAGYAVTHHHDCILIAHHTPTPTHSWSHCGVRLGHHTHPHIPGPTVASVWAITHTHTHTSMVSLWRLFGPSHTHTLFKLNN